MEPTLIIFSGLTGTGKSTLARASASRLQVPVFSLDYLVDEALPAEMLSTLAQTETLWDDLFDILFSFADLQLGLGVSLILDAIFEEDDLRQRASDLATHHRARFMPFLCTCSDKKLWQERVEKQHSNGMQASSMNWTDVQKSRQTFRPWRDDRVCVLDSARSLEDNVFKVIEVVTNMPHRPYIPVKEEE